MTIANNDRMRTEFLIWCPSIILVVTMALLEIPIWHPLEESYMGLRITTADIYPEKLFLPALERANVSISDPLETLGFNDTGLELFYEINEHGQRLQPKTMNVLETIQSNGSYGHESLFKDFPRQLLYSVASSSILNRSVPLDGPEDVLIDAIPEDIIKEAFRGALELKNEQREESLVWTVVLVVVIVVLSTFSIFVSGTGLYMLVFILWVMKVIAASPWSNDSDLEPFLNETQLCKLFASNTVHLGLALEFFPLVDRGYDQLGVFMIAFLGVYVAIGCGLTEFFMLVSTRCGSFRKK